MIPRCRPAVSASERSQAINLRLRFENPGRELKAGSASERRHPCRGAHQGGTAWNYLMAASTLVLLPVNIIFLPRSPSRRVLRPRGREKLNLELMEASLFINANTEWMPSAPLHNGSVWRQAALQIRKPGKPATHGTRTGTGGGAEMDWRIINRVGRSRGTSGSLRISG